MHTPSARFWAAMTLVTLVACGDGGTGPDDQLTLAEAQALFTASNLEALDYEFLDISPSGQISGTSPCPQGGRIDLAGTAVAQSGTTVRMDYTTSFHDCAGPSDVGVFTMDGTLRQVGTFVFSQTGESLTVDFEMDGRLDWSLGSRSGSCTFDLRMSGTDENISISGTVCGEQVHA